MTRKTYGTVCRALLSALLASGLALPAAEAQTRNIRFEQISTQHGLSHADVYSILQDRRGFMWFATQDGLNRYDGYAFTVFRHDPLDDGSLTHNYVYSVLEDETGTLWIGTRGGGINRLDPATHQFASFRHDPSDPNSLSNDRVRVLLLDSNGWLWAGTDGGGLNRFDRERQTFKRFTFDPGKSGSLPNDRILTIFEDSRRTLWIGTDGGGLSRFDPETESFQQIDDLTAAGISLTARVRALAEDRQGRLWVGTFEDGLYALDLETGGSMRFLHDPEDEASLSSNRIRTVFEDDSGTLWVGTDKGINAWIPEKRGFARYQHESGNTSSLGDNRVVSTYQDRGGVIWVGMQGGGVSKWNPRSGFFSSYQNNPADPYSLASNTISGFAEAPNGDLIVGTYNGVCRLDGATGRFVHHIHDPSDPGSLSDDRAMSITVDSKGRLWVGTLEGGLNRLDPGSRRFRRYLHDPDDPRSLRRNGVMSLRESRDGFLWLGTYGGGLNRLNPDTDEFIHYVHSDDNPTSISGDRVTVILEDSAGVLWVGTESNGLNRFDRNTGGFTHFRSDPNDPRSLSSNAIYSLLEDPDGVLWIGTQAGLNRWEAGLRRAHRAIFQRYTERDGLPNQAIFGILRDDAGYLWLSTNKGLSRFDPRTESFKNFDVSNGLLSNEYNFGAAYRHSSGKLFFGGNQGFNSFVPGDVGTNTYVPPVVLTSFLKFSQPVDLGEPLPEVEEITLTHKDYVVSFEFAALDYTASDRNRYAYMLEGFDADWIQLGGINRATYTNLDPGSYVFRVRGSNNDGTWNMQGASVAVRVVPPPWRSWWAYCLYGLAALLVALAYNRAQHRKLEQEAIYSRKLEREVQARTRELAEKNDALKYANRRLEEASVTDSLTGLRNRRYLLTSIQNDIGLVERFYSDQENRGETVPVLRPDFLFLIFDLDGFKEVNDTYGHAAGDMVLVQVRDLLRDACRDSDTLIRWGGDEFLVIGRNTDPKVAEGLAGRIKTKVDEHRFDVGPGRRVRLSCSIGFAGYPFMPFEPTKLHWEQVLGVADRALYIAKENGRNQWVGIFGTLETEKMASEDLIQQIYERPEALATQGIIEIRSSVPKLARAAGGERRR